MAETWGSTTSGSITWRSSDNDSTAWYSVTPTLDYAPQLLDAPAVARAKASRAEQRQMMLSNQRPRSVAQHARHGHQQMARLPCYRGVRTR